MKTPNLLSIRKKYLPAKERSIENLLKAISLIPLFLGVLLLIPAIGNPQAISSSFFMFGFLILLSFLSMMVQKQTKKTYLKRFTDKQLEQMENECLSAPHCDGLMVTSVALMYFMPTIMAIPIGELVWVYPLVETHRKGLLMNKTYYVIIAVTKDKKEYRLLRENMAQAQMERSMIFLHEALTILRPHLMLGYSESLFTISKKEFGKLAQMADMGTGFDKDTAVAKNVCDPRETEIIYP